MAGSLPVAHSGKDADVLMQAARKVCESGWKPGWWMIDKSRPEANAILEGMESFSNTDCLTIFVQFGQILHSDSASSTSFKPSSGGMPTQAIAEKRGDHNFQ